jgi:hypothetical protein
MNYYWCCEVGNHPFTTQDGHSWVPFKFWTKMVQGLPSLTIGRMQHNIGVFAFMFPFLVSPHLLCYFFK